MTILKLGKLYHLREKFHLLLLPSWEKALVADLQNMLSIDENSKGMSQKPTAISEKLIDIYATRLGCKVHDAKPTDILMFVEEKTVGDVRYTKFLGPNYIGWTVYKNWIQFVEITDVRI